MSEAQDSCPIAGDHETETVEQKPEQQQQQHKSEEQVQQDTTEACILKLDSSSPKLGVESTEKEAEVKLDTEDSSALKSDNHESESRKNDIETASEIKSELIDVSQQTEQAVIEEAKSTTTTGDIMDKIETSADKGQTEAKQGDQKSDATIIPAQPATETPEVSSTKNDEPAPKTTRSSSSSGRRPSYNSSRGYAGGYQNYGLTYLPYKSNFEPSEDARRKADEFFKTLKL